MTEVASPVAPAQGLDRVVLIAGMHRSGTSAAAGTLHRLGIPAVGPHMSATPENPRGYYESLAVMEFHQAFLSAIGSDWTDPEPIDPDLFRTAEGARWVADLMALINSDLLGTGPTFAVKDPRLCRLLPLWRAALAGLGVAPRVLIPLRHPRAVAASLLERRGMDEGRARSLWLTHVIEAERDTRDLARAFVVYDRLLDDPLPTVERLVDQLAVREQVDFAGVWPSIQDFLADELRRHRPDSAGEPVGAGELADRCWASLQPFLASPYDLGAMHGLDLLRRVHRAQREGRRPLEIARTRVPRVLQAALPRPSALDVRFDETMQALRGLRYDLAQTQRTLNETRKPLWRIRSSLSRLRRRIGYGAR